MNGRQSTEGLGFAGALLLLFVALKLVGVLTWSWWWVLSPAWIPAALAILVCVTCAAALLGIELVEKGRAKRGRERRRRAAQAPEPYEHGPARRWRP